jgi:hypothetical protein
MRMRALDVLLQVLLFDIIFVAVIVGTYERSVVSVGAEVSCETGRPLFASISCDPLLDSKSGGEDGDRSRDWLRTLNVLEH